MGAVDRDLEVGAAVAIDIAAAIAVPNVVRHRTPIFNQTAGLRACDENFPQTLSTWV